MARNTPYECCVLTLQQGGLVQAQVKDDIDKGNITLDGYEPQDESCQFYLHDREVEHQGKLLRVYRFESVKYRDYNLRWNNKQVNLEKCCGTNDVLAHFKYIWWIIADCDSLTAVNEGCLTSTGYKLLTPFDYAMPSNVLPYYLVFDDNNPRLTPTMPKQNGQFKLEPLENAIENFKNSVAKCCCKCV